ncbi:hypothetical protein HYZ41_02240 [archaeon]|nr:hypothetical protein [archaeon]
MDKRNLKSKIFTIPYDKDQAESIINRFRMLNGHLKDETIPVPEARSTRGTIWMCRLCEYRDRCYSETSKDTKWM